MNNEILKIQKAVRLTGTDPVFSRTKALTAAMMLVCIFSCILIAEEKNNGGQYK